MSKKTAVLDLTGKFTKDLVAKLDHAETQCYALREALQELLDASPTGFGNDRRLNEAQKVAEALLKENL